MAQLNCVAGDVTTNVENVVRQIHAAAAQSSALVVFPEMCDTGYEMDTILRTASSWDAAPYMTVAKTARERKIAVAIGLSERKSEGIYNSVAVINADGELIARHRKTHLMNVDPVREVRHLRAGDSLRTFEFGGFRFGLVICYEVRFPEVSRALAVSGAEVLLVQAAFPHARREHWKVLTRARAIENQAYVVAVNRVGSDGGMEFAGTSVAYDPYGVVEAEGTEQDEALLFTTLRRENLERVREGLRVFDDRRESVYLRVSREER